MKWALGALLAWGKEVPCSCECCSVVNRSPAEIIGPTFVKCATAFPGETGSGCPEQCQLPIPARVIQNADVALTDQFCFLECKANDETLGSQCVALTTEEAMRARTDDGSGEDVSPLPAIYAPKEVSKPAPIIVEEPSEGTYIGTTEEPQRSMAEEQVRDTEEAFKKSDVFDDEVKRLTSEATDAANRAESHAHSARDAHQVFLSLQPGVAF